MHILTNGNRRRNSIPSLRLLPGPLWPIRVPLRVQTEIFNHFLFLKLLNCVQTNNWCWMEFWKTRSRRYPTWTIMDTNYTDNIVLLANTSTQAKSLLHSLEQTTGGIGLHVNADKTEYICFNQRGNISTLNGGSLKLVDKFISLRSSILSTKNYITM